MRAAGEEGRDFEVLPENWPVVQAWLRVQTQWRMSFGGPVGLDYPAVESVLRRLDPRGWEALFDGVQVMEFAVLAGCKD